MFPHKPLIVPLVLLFAGLSRSVHADPCGMVPPIYDGNGNPIVRIGVQKTYVFYKGGIETFVIRPGFRGKVEEFGMLIPFPTPPAIRKVPDNVFEQVAAAIDPPEVVIDLRPPPPGFGGLGGMGGMGMGGGGALGMEVELPKDKVRVIREEAVGMYEVAVLEAGSAQALKRWMDDHGYRYPEGMDAACDDYVRKRWCFVAVKTRVGAKSGVDPKPGMRSVNAKLPEGASFDGYVQAMGFRFRSRTLEVPMRLSAFNEGELRNIVYVLADEPLAVSWMPPTAVVRQVSGRELYKNVTRPLPVRVLGAKVVAGRITNLTRRQLKAYDTQRDPGPHNGVARDLFASDLLATIEQRLAHPHEQREKTLLEIGERLGLRGPEIDRLNQDELMKDRSKNLDKVLPALRSMTLTVIDSDFPRPLLASRNVTFLSYTMPGGRNTSRHYDAKQEGPVGRKEGLLLKTAALDTAPADLAEKTARPERAASDSTGHRPSAAPSVRPAPMRLVAFALLAVVVVVAFGCARQRSRR